MLKDRIVTALVLLTIFFLTLMASSPVYFGLLTLLFVAIAAWEWGRLSGYLEGMSCALALAVMLVCSFLWCFGWVERIPAKCWFFTAAIWLFVALWLLKGGTGRWLTLPAQARWVLGAVILSVAWCALWVSKLQSNNFLLSVLFLVWMSDTGAYFVGRRFGRHKLAPSISPGKSWEGAWGGVITVILLSGIWVAFDLYTGSVDRHASIFTRLTLNGGVVLMFLTVAFMAIVGILGDLTESLMKRSVGLKDSGNVLPGHGGVLDRVDALLPVLPLAAGFMRLLS